MISNFSRGWQEEAAATVVVVDMVEASVVAVNFSPGWGHGDWQEGEETVDWRRYHGRRLGGFIWY